MPSAPIGLADVGALMMVQGAADREGRRRRAVVRGRALLDDLDALTCALLAGRASEALVSRLTARLAERDDVADEPGLSALMGEIETRAAVELAKLGR